MITVALYGVENSHADAFAAAFRASPAFSDFRVSEVGGIYPDAVADLAARYGAKIENDPAKMAEDCDCGMITCRDGKYHLEAALPFIRAGKPIFLDKPLTSTVEDLETLARELKAHGQSLVGGSSVKIAKEVEEAAAFAAGKTVLAGNITCPAELSSPYGGFVFYASHLAETLLRVFGYDPTEVEAFRMPGGLFGTVYYGDVPVRFTYLDEVYDYLIEVDTKEGVYQSRIDVGSIHEKETAAFCRFVKTGESDFTLAELAKPVYLFCAMTASLASGKREKIGSLPAELC